MKSGTSARPVETRPDAGPGTGLPDFDEAPLVAVDFAPRALRPPTRRGSVLAGVWAAGLAGIIGLGLLSGGPPGGSTDGTTIGAGGPSSEPPPIARSGWPPNVRAVAGVVRLEAPPPAIEVETRQVAVRGSMLVRADHVGIALEARGNRVLEQVWLDVFDPDGGIRPSRTATFEAFFELPFPRPNGTMWVVVTAYDEGNMPLGSTRRPFTVGPLGQTGFVPIDPSLGGTGPLGPSNEPPPPTPQNAAPLPTCLPVSTTLASSC